jgi:hypothetical protein
MRPSRRRQPLTKSNHTAGEALFEAEHFAGVDLSRGAFFSVAFSQFGGAASL